MGPLATPEDVAKLGVDTSDTELVAFLLDSVSSAVRDAAGGPITSMTSTVTYPGTREQFLPLVGSPIRSVDRVVLDGRDLPDDDWLLRDTRLWRAQGWIGQHKNVDVTYTFGLDTVPADIVKLVATLVAAGINEAADGVASKRNLAYMRIDDYQEGYLQGDNEVVDLTEIPQRTKDALRKRFSAGAAYVTGSY
jgi:hypothetical protein